MRYGGCHVLWSPAWSNCFLFLQIEAEYASSSDEEGSFDEEDEMDELATPPVPREDFDSIMDDFLSHFEVLGGKMKPVLPGDTPAEKLDTIRKELIVDEFNESRKGYEGRKRKTKEVEYLTVKPEDEKERWDVETVLCECCNSYKSRPVLNLLPYQLPIVICRTTPACSV
jgi:protein LTV1